MYAAILTRPEIMYPVQALSQHLMDPGEAHWIAAKRVLRYLKGTKNHGLNYKWADEADVVPLGYCNTDWGVNVDDRRSISGYVYTLGGGAIAWSAKKQPTMATSTVEAEYIADRHAMKQALWLQRLLGELHFPQTDATLIKSDNVGAISLTNDPTFYARTKHIDVQHHFIRERIALGHIKLVYEPTTTLIADIMTKPLEKTRFQTLTHGLGVISLEGES